MGGLSIWSARFCTFAKRLALIEGCAILGFGTKGEENAISSFQKTVRARGPAASCRLRCGRRGGSSSAAAPRTVTTAANLPDELCAGLRATRIVTPNLQQFVPGAGRGLPHHFQRSLLIEAGVGLGRRRRNAPAAPGQQAGQAGSRRMHAGVHAGLRATRQ